jgi:hypothetical protein
MHKWLRKTIKIPEGYSILDYNTICFGETVTFRRNILPPFSVSKRIQSNKSASLSPVPACFLINLLFNTEY